MPSQIAIAALYSHRGARAPSTGVTALQRSRPHRVAARPALALVEARLHLLEPFIGRAYAAPVVPDRVLTVFFGLGLPKPLQAEGFSGPLAPLASLANKLSIVRGLNMPGVDSPINNHLDGGAGVFVGAAPRSDARAGGPSFDEVVRGALYPMDPPTAIKRLSMGTSFRRTGLVRHVHAWHEDGTPADLPLETPAALFSRLFGEAPGLDDEQKRRKRSVLDSVLLQYRSLTGARSPLSARSQQRLSDHLDKLRELERQTFPEASQCARGDNPGEPPLLRGQPTQGTGPELDVGEWIRYWRLMVDLYVTGLRCDLFRIGNVAFQSAGDRVKLRGAYRDDSGALIADFADTMAHHEYWHQYQESSPHEELRAHAYLIQEQVAYLLKQLDDPAHVDENGGTLLDNAMVLIGTELGNGAAHDFEGVLHAVSSACGRFRVGGFLDVEGTVVDLYNTCLQGLAIDRTMGDPQAFNGPLEPLLA